MRPLWTAQAQYAAVVARYSSPAIAPLGRLLLPYLFPELSAFATVEDLVSHLRISNARYRATVSAEFLDRNQPPMFITLYFIVTRLPDSLRSVRDHFLYLDPTSLTVDLLEQHLLAVETSAVAVGAARGTPRPPFFEGCSPSPLAHSYASSAAADVPGAEDIGAASASAKRRSGKGKGGKGGGGGSGGGGGGSGSGSGGSGGGGGGSGGSGGRGGSGTGGSETGAQRVGSGGGQRQQQQRRSETQSPPAASRLHTQHHCFSRLDDAWRAEFGDDVELPRWADLLRSRFAILDLDFDAIMILPKYLPGTAPAQALNTFTLDSRASRCFFRESTTLTPLPAPVPVTPADPSGGPVVARSSTVLPCPEVPSSSLSGLHLPSFSTNLVSIAALQDVMVTTTTPRGQRVSICTCTRTGRHMATFTRQVAASCSCRLLSHQTLLWHHRLGHPSLPRLRGMHSHLLVSSLPRSLPPLPPSPAPPCLPCVEGRQRAAPHSSSFPSTTAPLQTLHMDVWGPARVSEQSRERYFLLVVDDYTRYTTVFPLRNKGEVVDVWIPWIRTVRHQLRERFGHDLPVLRLHSDRGGEFSSNLLREFCRGEGILQSFTLPDSAQQNGIAERRIGLVMEPRVSLPETSPTLRWTGEVGDASVFWVWGSRAFVRDTSADKLSAHAILCVFLGFVRDAPGWQFYHPTSRRVLPSQDVTFDESVPFYRLFPYRSAPPLPPPLFLAPGPPPVDPLPPQGPAPSGVSQVDPLLGTAPVKVAVGSGAAPCAASRGAEPGGAGSEGDGSGGAEPRGEEPGGAEHEGVEPGGAQSEGAESGGAEPRGAASSGGPAVASSWLSPQQLREWLVWRARLQTRAPGAGGAGDVGAGGNGTGVTAGASGTGGIAAAGPGGARTRGAGAAETGNVGGARAGDPTELGAAGAGDSCAGGAGARGAGAGRAGPTSPLLAPSPYTEQSGGLPERRELASRLVSHVRTARGVPRLRPPPVPARTLWHSSTVSRLLPTTVKHPFFESAAASALVAELLDIVVSCRLDYATALVPESESASPPSVGVPITGPYSSQWQAAMDAQMASWKSTGTYVDEVPPLGANIVDGMWIFRVKRPPGSPPAFKARYVARRFSQRQGVDYYQTFSPNPNMTSLRLLLHVAAQRDYELHSLGFSTAFLQGSLHEEIWLRRTPGFTETTLAALRFAPSTADPSLFLRTDTSLSLFYVLVYVDNLVFATADTEAVILVKSELQKRHTCTDLGELRSYLGLQITRDRARRTITLTQPHMVHQVLQRFGLQFSSPQPTPLSTSHSLPAPPLDESVEPSGPYPELVGCLMYLMTCTQPDLAYPLSLLACYVAPGRHRKVHWDAAKRVLRYLCSTSGMGLVLGGRGPVVLTGHVDASWVDDSAMQQSSQGYTFSLGSGSVSWRSTRSSSVLSSSCEAEIYAGAMAAQELHWLTYVLTDLGEQPRVPPILYVNKKAMIALSYAGAERPLFQRRKYPAKTGHVRRQRKVKNEPCAEPRAGRRVPSAASGVQGSRAATPPPPDDVVSHLRNPNYQRDFQMLAPYGPHGVGCQLTAQDALTLADGECLADTVVDFHNM
ncbi:unnamed protein product [Closterium sp. NIES-54]